MPKKQRIIIIAGPNGAGKTGLRNFQKVYMYLVDNWEWYDNAGNTPQLISAESNR
jgi:predicted ABC-type ATPase